MTSIDGLYAAGECSHTGVHGAKSTLPATLCLRLLYFHAPQLRILQKNYQEIRKKTTRRRAPAHKPLEGKPMPHGCRSRIREIMQDAYFVIPKPEKYDESYREVEKNCK